VVALEEGIAVIDTGGVGYEVLCHLRTIASLHGAHADSEEVTLHIHTGVSDDAIRLYGFTTALELRLFRLLIQVERIGPKAALGILGRAEPAVLIRAISSGDAGLVTTVPGIGRKTADRVILELRDKLDGLAPPTGEGAATPDRSHSATAAIEGLVGLGFREAEARAAVGAAVAELGGASEVGALVSAALRRLDAATAPVVPVAP
jgi:Holliday junction DNA helicase RuvA